ncbi:hypothetical protein CH371_13885 [Leptospira wolffii]|uniref:Uncharacterized protein n=1 Tax=Leptospira wolffii TaxID=409998 RepID=A0A2M9ZAJ2_9LEPT|nr:hypothetical protein [Leptospira wolffii]PJZ65471.1 hypothetical protein CH371_13885 [Leptospira wolffii]
MKDELISLAKTAAKSSGKILLFSFLALVLGLIINVIFLILCIPEMKSIVSQIGAMPIARAGGIGAVIALVFLLIGMWPIVLLITSFGLGFPIAYLLSVKSHMMSREIAKLISEHKGWFVDNISRFATNQIWKRVDSKNPGAVKQAILTKLKNIPALLNEEDSWPAIVRIFVRKILKSLHLEEIAREIAEKHSENESFTKESLEESLNKSFHKAIDEKLEPSPPILLYSLIALNLGIFLFVKILY